MGVASKRFMNWANTSFAITAGTSVSITGVESVTPKENSEVITYEGDNDFYPSTTVCCGGKPMLIVQTADLGALLSLPSGTVGTFTTTRCDAKNGIGSGAITYTFHCMVSENSSDGKHKAFGMGTLELTGVSPDGTTNPLTTSVAP